jgi:selenocysteine-specific translation elongation factor
MLKRRKANSIESSPNIIFNTHSPHLFNICAEEIFIHFQQGTFMHFIVSIPFDQGLAESIGKKGSEEGIAFYNRKEIDDVIVCLVPTDPDGKYYTVAESMMLADQVVLSTRNMGSNFGEALIAAGLLGKRVIFTNENDVSKFAKGVDYVVADRERVLEAILGYRPDKKVADQGNVVLIDRVFPVKGVGTVALGFVKSGRIRVHDTLLHNSGKSAFVRSIQVQDVDRDEAEAGTRVGLALKGLDYGEIDKGDTLSDRRIEKVEELTAALSMSEIGQEYIVAGRRYTLVSDFIVSEVEVLEFDESKNIVRFGLAKAAALQPGDEFLLLRNGIPRMFARGTVR